MFSLLLLPVLAQCSGGSDGGSPACVQDLPSACQPLYDPPIYPTLFEKTFKPTCAAPGGSCHTGDSAKGGLVFEDPDVAYGLLLGTRDGRKRVIPGDAACSLLVQRIESADPAFRMPPGSVGLSDA